MSKAMNVLKPAAVVVAIGLLGSISMQLNELVKMERLNVELTDTALSVQISHEPNDRQKASYEANRGRSFYAAALPTQNLFDRLFKKDNH